jgi:signal transduction histidine kinase
MGLHNSFARLVGHPRLRPRTVRLRLALLYGGLFLASGAVLLAITNVLVRHNTSAALPKGLRGTSIAVTKAPGTATQSLPGLGAVAPGASGSTAATAHAAAAAHAAVLHQLDVQSGIALCVMAAVSAALGWIVAGRVLRPIDTMTTAVHRITATNLHERLALDGPDDELKKLGDTFDELLTRLEKSFDAQRQFVANASHELRTPLTRQRTVAQVALADPDATVESLRASHQQVLASGAQQERMIEALLTLTRVQAGLDRQEAFDLATVTNQILVAHRPEAKRRGIALHSEFSPTAMRGDPRTVVRLVSKLIDNALRHNLADGQVEIVTKSCLGHPVLSVINTGPVVPETAIHRILQPFQRLGPDRTSHDEGLGLGLSIVQAIADAHDAALTLRPKPGGGLHIEVRFPEPTVLINSGEPTHVASNSKA